MCDFWKKNIDSNKRRYKYKETPANNNKNATMIKLELKRLKIINNFPQNPKVGGTPAILKTPLQKFILDIWDENPEDTQKSDNFEFLKIKHNSPII